MDLELSYADLHRGDHPALIFRAISGSRAYGTFTDQSDTDIRGIFVLPEEAYLRLAPSPEQIANESSDVVYYSLRRFLELASAANPNIVELLFLPGDCLQYCHAIADQLIANKTLFISQQCYDSHVAYAQGQLKRSRGQNKWINNPKPEAAPTPEDYCWFIPRDNAQWNYPNPPLRPVSLLRAGINLSECHASAVEHCPGVYRLYHVGSEARGVFRNGQVVCESIPLALEQSCLGLFVYNQQAYESERKDHTHYWQWRQTRNVSRWLMQERGEIDYDAKNLMHTFRLLLSAENIFKSGEPKVRFEGEDLDFLLNIRKGVYSYDQLLAFAEEQINKLEHLKKSSHLPLKADSVAVDSLLINLTQQWSEYQDNA